MKQVFIVLDPNYDPVFNCDTQSNLYFSVEACHEGIKDELDEPQSEDAKGNVHTARSDGWDESMYYIFKMI